MSETVANGRFRFRNEALKVVEFGYVVRDALLEVRGVLDVQVNNRVGSLLVIYDKARTSLEELIRKVAESLGVDLDKVHEGLKKVRRSLDGREGRKLVKRGLMASLAVALGIVFYSERAHVIAGAAFLGLLHAHLYQNRRTLFR